MKVLSLFDGMSCGQIALEKAGIHVDEYYASEIDKYAIKVTQNNYPDTIQLGDIQGWKSWDIPWGSIDLILAGSPCQGFSYSGKQLAFNDPRSKLYFTFEDILNYCNPKHWFLENVRMKSESLNTISERLGVKPFKCNSSLVSAQNRVRYYWFNWENPDIENKNIQIQNLIPEAVGVWTWPRGWNKGGYRETSSCPTITTSSWQHNFKWFDDTRTLHRFTPEQAEQLQTVPVGYTKVVSENQRFKLLGNGWTVDVVKEILKNGLR
jgi:site-specific DNA-cytosine methylase